MNYGNLVATNGKARVYRKETFNHRTTAAVEWLVIYTQATGREVIAQACKTRKDALQWANIYCN